MISTRVRRMAWGIMSHRTQALLTAAVGLTLCANAAMAQSDGAALFTQNCSACHQSTGKGIPGAFPALAGDPFVVGPAKSVVSVVLNGRGGMPAFGKDLTDEQIAAILSYIRSFWGNHGPAVVMGEVKAGRTPANQLDKTEAAQAH